MLSKAKIKLIVCVFAGTNFIFCKFWPKYAIWSLLKSLNYPIFATNNFDSRNIPEIKNIREEQKKKWFKFALWYKWNYTRKRASWVNFKQETSTSKLNIQWLLCGNVFYWPWCGSKGGCSGRGMVWNLQQLSHLTTLMVR